MGEEHPSSQKDMWLVPRHTLEPVQQRLIDSTRPELVYELVVVDRELLPVRGDGALHVPRRDDLPVRVRRRGRVRRGRGRICLLLGVWGDGRGLLCWFG